jgi:predicted GIY-YIG superfamily endonuclease
MAWFCYIIRCVDANHTNLTYNGSTNDPIRRLKQHNGSSASSIANGFKCSGGAKATKGKNWIIYALMTGFENHQNVLQCEWRIKHPTKARKRPAKYCGVAGRIKGLNEVLCADKWTSQCDINNCDGNFTLYLAHEFVSEINQEIVPPNINIVSVDKIDNEFLLDKFYAQEMAEKAQKEKDKLEKKEQKEKEKLEKKEQKEKDKLEKKLQKDKEKLEKSENKIKHKKPKDVIVGNTEEYIIVDNIEDE